MSSGVDSAAVEVYLEQSVRDWLGLPATSNAAVPALPPRLARRVLRVEEHEIAHRDQWDCWEYAFNESFRDGTLFVPEIDDWAAEQRRALGGAGHDLEPLWPDGHPFAVCLTHDVDLMSEASTSRQALRSMRAGLAATSSRDRFLRYARPPVRAARTLRKGVSTAPAADALELCVEIERGYGLPASYFFTVFPDDPSRYDCVYLPSDACRFRGARQTVADVLRTLAGEGFDVGVHGSYGSAVEPGRLSRERDVLAHATGLDIRTTRQHFIHWRVGVTPRLQEAAGITADTTLGFNRGVGFRAATSLPFRMFDLERDSSLELLEVPFAVHDGALLRSDALELDVELACRTIQSFMDAVAASGGVASLLFHPNNLLHPDFLELYRFSIAYGRERNGWFASLRDIERWWRRRSARLAARD